MEAATDTSIRNKQGETALDIGVRKGLGEIVSILECGNMRNIISDLEPGAGAGSSGQESHGGECPEVRQILKKLKREIRWLAGTAAAGGCVNTKLKHVKKAL